jgi:ubiquinone/menaquinone biosynthesis C-methylase UbiE
MKKEHKQTWWDKEIKSKFNEFKSWVGSTNEASKIWARKYLTGRRYKSILDIGCGMCDDYFEYKKLDPTIVWGGLDSSKFLSEKRNKKIPVLNREADNTKFDDSSWEVVYSRHVLEHQASFRPVLTEMIRISSGLVMHIFFIPPREKEIINYNATDNLYHNTFSRPEIEEFLHKNLKVHSWGWFPIDSTTEEALVIRIDS